MKVRVEKNLRGNDHEHIPYPTHIQSLPNEILAEIFKAGVSIPKTWHGTLPLPFQCAVSGVNRRWRMVAVSTPHLWSTIIFHCDTWRARPDLDDISLWIERSSPCALDITIVVMQELSNVASTMDQIILHADRWHRLTIKDISGYMVEPIIESLRTASAPRLQHFDLSVSQEYGHFTLTRDNIFTGGATALTSARIVGLCRMCTPPLVGLTALQFGGACRASGSVRLTHEEFRDLLKASPSLADLALQALELQTSPGASASNICMPSLRALSLNFACCEDSFVQIFTLLSMPVLETLSLAYMTTKHMSLLVPFSETDTPQYAALHTLKLFRCCTFLEYSNEPPDNFFSTFSSVAHLYLIFTASFILEPPSFYRTGKIPWPNLKSVTVLPKVLPSLILTRKASGHPITTAYIPRECLSSDEILWARVREDVEVLEVYNDSNSVQYPGGLDHCVEEEEGCYNIYSEYFEDDSDDDRRKRHAFFEQSYGVDYHGSDDSELLEYWAVCGSD
jgi:hypothetical protein